MTTPDVAKAEAFYTTTCDELVSALDGAIPQWLATISTQRGYPLAVEDPLVVDVHATMMHDLRDAYGGDGAEASAVPLDSVRNPLDILRRGVGPLNERLAAEAIEEPQRDEVQRELFPDDLYDLAPGAFVELGDAVHNAGLRWGAAKAHLHLIRHRPQTASEATIASPQQDSDIDGPDAS